jgi:hypothetical protein
MTPCSTTAGLSGLGDDAAERLQGVGVLGEAAEGGDGVGDRVGEEPEEARVAFDAGDELKAAGVFELPLDGLQVEEALEGGAVRERVGRQAGGDAGAVVGVEEAREDRAGAARCSCREAAPRGRRPPGRRTRPGSR